MDDQSSPTGPDNDPLRRKRAEADSRRAELRSFYAARGLFASPAFVDAAFASDVEASRAYLSACVLADKAKLPVTEDETQVQAWLEESIFHLSAAIEGEIDWLLETFSETARHLPKALSEAKARITAVRERLELEVLGTLRSAAALRNLELKPVYFPDVPMVSWSETRSYDVDATEISERGDLGRFMNLMYEEPDHQFYVFVRDGRSVPVGFQRAKDRGEIVVIRTESRFFLHPTFGHDWIQIKSDKPEWDWERELVASAPRFSRLFVRLSDKERTRRAAIEASMGPNLESAVRSLWVLECSETHRQGTAFDLAGLGTITCAHVLGPATRARRRGSSQEYVPRVISSDPRLDLAILNIPADRAETLTASVQTPSQQDPIWVVGFPNHREGDTHAIHKGEISGFREVDHVKRLMLSAAVVAGMSGGPVFDRHGSVVGVAVTGADDVSSARETENHGAIPLEALGRLLTE